MYLNEQLIREETSYQELFYYLLDEEGNVIDSKGDLIMEGVLPDKDVLQSTPLLNILDKYNEFISSDKNVIKHDIAISHNGNVILMDWCMRKNIDATVEFTGNKTSNPVDYKMIPIEKLPYPIAVVKESGELIQFNHSFIDYFIENRIVIQPLYIQDVIDTNELSPEQFDYAKMISRGVSYRSVLCRYREESDNQTFLLNLIPTQYGESTHYLATIKDLTQFIEVQQSLENQNEDLRRQVSEEFEVNKSFELELLKKNRLESLGEIASGIFHELNQPLTHLSLKLDNMLDRWKNGQVSEEYLFTKTEQIQRQILRMRGIIDEMKQFSSVPEKKDQLVDVKKVLNCALEDVSYLNVNGLILSVKQIEDTFIKGSANELEQVFVNILTNSLQSLLAKQKKHINHKSKLKISVRRTEELIRMDIIDNGLGANKEDLESLFKPFYTTKKAEGGTGLGLFIINNLMRKMNGTITIDSRLGKYFKTSLAFPVIKEL